MQLQCSYNIYTGLNNITQWFNIFFTIYMYNLLQLISLIVIKYIFLIARFQTAVSSMESHFNIPQIGLIRTDF